MDHRYVPRIDWTKKNREWRIHSENDSRCWSVDYLTTVNPVGGASPFGWLFVALGFLVRSFVLSLTPTQPTLLSWQTAFVYRSFSTLPPSPLIDRDTRRSYDYLSSSILFTPLGSSASYSSKKSSRGNVYCFIAIGYYSFTCPEVVDCWFNSIVTSIFLWYTYS